MINFLLTKDAYILNWGFGSPLSFVLDRTKLNKHQSWMPVGYATSVHNKRLIERIQEKMRRELVTKIDRPPSQAFYQMPRSTRIWRAGKKDFSEFGLYWFAFEPVTSSEYTQPSFLRGDSKEKTTFWYRDNLRPITAYKISRRRLIFFNFDHEGGREAFLLYMKDRNAPEDVQEAFRLGWGRIRRSYLMNDITVSNWLCEQGDVDGYISYHGSKNLWPEIMICNPETKLQEDLDAPIAQLDIPMLYTSPYDEYDLRLHP